MVSNSDTGLVIRSVELIETMEHLSTAHKTLTFMAASVQMLNHAINQELIPTAAVDAQTGGKKVFQFLRQLRNV